MSKKISQLSLATDVTAADLLQVVDIEDGAMAQSGTNKKVTANILAQDLGKLMSVTATGSTQSRKITDRFADVVNVKDFGAIGDGVADDTAAIQAAIDSLPDSFATGAGGTVLFNAGRYLITSPIQIKFGVNLVGENGRYASNIVVAPSFVGNFAISFLLGNASFNQGNIHGLGINCNNVAGVGGLLYESAYQNVVIKDMFIYNVSPSASGIFIKPASTGVTVCESVLLENIYIVSNAGSIGVVSAPPLIRLEKCQETTLVNVKAIGNVNSTPYSGSIGLSLVDCRGVTTIGGATAFCEKGISVVASTRLSQGISINGMTYEGNSLVDLFALGNSNYIVRELFNYSPRYQDPFAAEAINFDYVNFSHVDVFNRPITLGANAKAILIFGSSNAINADSNARFGAFSYPSAADTDFIIRPNVEVQSSNTPQTKYTVIGRSDGSYAHRWSASSSVDNGFQLLTKGGRAAYIVNDNGTDAQIGFLGNAAVSRRVVSGSKGGNAALASLITALQQLGLIDDSTT